MTRSRTSWTSRIGLLLIWLALTAGVAFLAGRAAADTAVVDVTAPLPPVTIDQRATVSLEERTVQPIVSANATVVQTEGGFALEAFPPSDAIAYRLLDPPYEVRALINGGPAGFECDWIGLAEPGGSTFVESARGFAMEQAAGVPMRCAIPDDVRVVPGMSGLMVLQMSEPQTVIALPVTAVLGSTGQGQVVIVHDDGTTTRRAVTLGTSDIYYVEIVDGLEPDERVLGAPVQFDFAQAGES